MRSKLSTILALALFVSAAHVCRARGEPDLEKAVSSATTIIIGRLDQYIPEPESLDRLVEHNFRANPGSIIGGNAESVYLGAVQCRGTYAFHVTTALKGKPPETLVVRLPRFSGIGHRFGFMEPGGPAIPLKANYLMMLSGDAEQGYAPTTLAPIPATPKASLLKPFDDMKPDEQVAAVRAYFVASLEDADGRSMAAYMLSGSKDKIVLEAMRPYADDKNAEVRASALQCMALNQDLSAIGKIAATHEGLQSLEEYRTEEAIPLLNRVIAENASPYARNSAVLALRNLPPSKTSVPALIKALRDKDRLLARNAYWQLQKVLPELGLVAVRDEPAETQIQQVEKWWAENQKSGKQ